MCEWKKISIYIARMHAQHVVAIVRPNSVREAEMAYNRGFDAMDEWSAIKTRFNANTNAIEMNKYNKNRIRLFS